MITDLTTYVPPSRTSDTCAIQLSLHLRRPSATSGLTIQWLGELTEAPRNPQCDPITTLWSDGPYIRHRDRLLRALKNEALYCGYKRCVVYGDKGGVLSDAALRHNSRTKARGTKGQILIPTEMLQDACFGLSRLLSTEALGLMLLLNELPTP